MSIYCVGGKWFITDLVSQGDTTYNFLSARAVVWGAGALNPPIRLFEYTFQIRKLLSICKCRKPARPYDVINLLLRPFVDFRVADHSEEPGGENTASLKSTSVCLSAKRLIEHEPFLSPLRNRTDQLAQEDVRRSRNAPEYRVPTAPPISFSSEGETVVLGGTSASKSVVAKQGFARPSFYSESQ